MELVLQAPGLSIEQPKTKSASFIHHIIRVENSRGSERNNSQENILMTSVPLSDAIALAGGDNTIDAVLVSPDIANIDLAALKDITRRKAIPLILSTPGYDVTAKKTALTISADDYHYGTLNGNFFKRLEFIKRVKSYKNLRGDRPYVAASVDLVPQIKLWSLKRAFDILVSATALFILSPLCLLIGLIIKLVSKGPLF